MVDHGRIGMAELRDVARSQLRRFPKWELEEITSELYLLSVATGSPPAACVRRLHGRYAEQFQLVPQKAANRMLHRGEQPVRIELHPTIDTEAKSEAAHAEAIRRRRVAERADEVLAAPMPDRARHVLMLFARGCTWEAVTAAMSSARSTIHVALGEAREAVAA